MLSEKAKSLLMQMSRALDIDGLEEASRIIKSAYQTKLTQISGRFYRGQVVEIRVQPGQWIRGKVTHTGQTISVTAANKRYRVVPTLVRPAE